jgi:hypothetical protein
MPETITVQFFTVSRQNMQSSVFEKPVFLCQGNLEVRLSMESSTFRIGNHLHTCVASYVDVETGHLFMFVERINHGFKVAGAENAAVVDSRAAVQMH